MSENKIDKNFTKLKIKEEREKNKEKLIEYKKKEDEILEKRKEKVDKVKKKDAEIFKKSMNGALCRFAKQYTEEVKSELLKQAGKGEKK